MDNQLKSKEIFSEYLGNYFGMDHDGVLEEYEKFHISKETEVQWRKELIAKLINELPNSISSLATMEAIETIPEILKYTNQGDGFYRCRLGEILYQMARTAKADKNPNWELINLAQKEAFKIWEELIINPNQNEGFELDPQWEPAIIVNNDYIKKRASDNLQNYKKRTSFKNF